MPINEQLNFSVSFAGAVKASASTTINDTSRPAYDYILVSDTSSVTPITESDIPTYHLASNVSAANEGDSVTFTLTTTMLDTGTSVPYTITGITAADLSIGSLTGNFVTDDTGKATTTVTLADDKLTDGTESLVITLNGKTTFKEVTVLDTSKTPTYDVGWYGNAAGTGNKLTSVSEGHAPYLVVLTTDVADGTVLNFTITGAGFTSADVGGAPLNASMTITGNRGYYLYNVTVDHTTEGDETITATVKLNTSTIGTATLTVMDTSVLENVATFKVGVWQQGQGVYDYGYIYPQGTGVLYNDGLMYDGRFVKFLACWVMRVTGNDDQLGLWFDVSDEITRAKLEGLNFKIKLTNLNNGTSCISPYLSATSFGAGTVAFAVAVNDDIPLVKELIKIFTLDTDVQLELIIN